MNQLMPLFCFTCAMCCIVSGYKTAANLLLIYALISMIAIIHKDIVEKLA